MNYTDSVKQEIIRNCKDSLNDSIIIMSAFVRGSNCVKFIDDALIFNTSRKKEFICEFAIARMAQIIKAIKSNISGELTVDEGKLRITGDLALRVAEILCIEKNADGTVAFQEMDLRAQSAARKYFCGIFLGSGYVADPRKSYRIEFSSSESSTLEQMLDLLIMYDISSGIVVRKGVFVLYVNTMSQTADMLRMLNATKAVLDYEDASATKIEKNEANRMMNCDNANIDKFLNAMQKYKDCIQYISDTKGLESLPDGLRQIAEEVLKDQCQSLAELGAKMNPPIGKSGANHRLRAIMELRLR